MDYYELELSDTGCQCEDTNLQNKDSSFPLLVIIPQVDKGVNFTLIFTIRDDETKKSYKASYDGTTYTNCKINTDGSILVTFQADHGLPQGRLLMESYFYEPNADYENGYLVKHGNSSTGIILYDGTTKVSDLMCILMAGAINGQAATIKIGTVTNGAPGTNAQVTNSGTSADAILDFVIPRAKDGVGLSVAQLTQDEYDALTTKDANTLYITPDEG